MHYESPVFSEEANSSRDELTRSHLNHLIMNYSEAKFQALELLLKRIPNLKIFSISAGFEMEMVDADRWQHLIDRSFSKEILFN